MSLAAVDDHAAPAPAPEPGRLARVRGRMWVVADATGTRRPLATAGPFSTWSRSSRWRTTRRARSSRWSGSSSPAPPSSSRPSCRRSPRTRSTTPRELDAFLDAVRWGAVTSADQRALQAPFRSGITIEDYQLEPVVRALRMPRTTLLIADDVGLGKTIEAGLVVQELLLRHRARTVLVVCPAALQVQWRDEMREKFGLEFRIVDRELLGRAAPLARGSGEPVHALPAADRVDRLAEGRPGHAAAARGAAAASGDPAPLRPADRRRGPQLRARRSRRPLRARHAADRGDPDARAALRAPAVPVGHAAQRLRELVHGAAGAARPAALRARRPARRRRRRARSRSAGSSTDARRRRRQPALRASARSSMLEVEYPHDERAVHADLAAYGAARARRLQRRRVAQTLAADFVVTLLKKRLFSSPAAFLRTLEVHRETLQRRETTRRRRPPVGAASAIFEDAEQDARRGGSRGGRRRRHAGGARGRRERRAEPPDARRSSALLDRMTRVGAARRGDRGRAHRAAARLARGARPAGQAVGPTSG